MHRLLWSGGKSCQHLDTLRRIFQKTPSHDKEQLICESEETMRRVAAWIVTFLVFAPSALRADFSYTQTTRVTGGSLLNMTRFMPGAGSIREPQTHTIAVKDGKMVTYDKDTATIIDPDAETMTQIDFKKKQYSVITFAEMKQALQALQQQMQQMQAQLQGEQAPALNPLEAVKVTVNDTGQSKVISGLNTKQFILTMEVAPPPNAPAGLPPNKTTMDAWITPTLPGYEEVTQVGLKMAAKMAELTPGTNPMAMFRPDVAKTANAMAQEMSKMQGIPVYETLTMAGFAPSGPNVGEAVKDGAKDAAKESAIQGALGRSRLGGLAGLGGLGRKKDEPPKQAPQQTQEVTLQPVTLMEQVTEITNLASTADASKFSVPAGFKQVENEMKKLGQRK
jgi:hypothetical protein